MLEAYRPLASHLPSLNFTQSNEQQGGRARSSVSLRPIFIICWNFLKETAAHVEKMSLSKQVEIKPSVPLGFYFWRSN
jgi:hypothetical protein